MKPTKTEVADALYGAMTDPIYVDCHACHAQPGDQCQWHRDGARYHDFRVRQAKRGPYQIKTEHALAHGGDCTDVDGLCSKCGQTIARLKAIPDTLKQPTDQIPMKRRPFA